MGYFLTINFSTHTIAIPKIKIKVQNVSRATSLIPLEKLSAEGNEPGRLSDSRRSNQDKSAL